MPTRNITVQGIADAVLDEPTADHQQADSVGQTIDMIRNTAIAGADAGALMGATTTLTVQEIVDGVWDELQSAHVTANTFGDFLDIEVSSRNSTTPPTAAAIADQVYDEARSGHVAAGSFGEFFEEMMDAAIVSDNFAESGLDVVRRISAETMGTVTANSLMAKFTGMTDAQAVATSSGLSLGSRAVRTSQAESTTTTIQPASGVQHVSQFWRESGGGASIADIDISMDRTNFIDNAFSMDENIEPLLGATSTLVGFGAVLVNNSGQFDWTTPATVGTYITQENGYTLS